MPPGDPMYHADRVVREEGEMEKSYHIEYGFMRVRLPGRKEVLALVAVRLCISGTSEAGGFGVPCAAGIEAALRDPRLPVLRRS